MFDLLDSFDITANFWEVNKQMLVVKEFHDLYKSDKTRNKTYSSKVMWATCLLEHPDSKFINMHESDRLQLINEDFMETSNLDPLGKHEGIIKAFKKVCLTRAQRIAVQWGNKLDERFTFFDGIDYQLSTAKELDDAMGRTDKLWNQYQKCLKDLEQESAMSQVKGGAMESLQEKGDI